MSVFMYSFFNKGQSEKRGDAPTYLRLFLGGALKSSPDLTKRLVGYPPCACVLICFSAYFHVPWNNFVRVVIRSTGSFFSGT